jgi:hypothetical protein
MAGLAILLIRFSLRPSGTFLHVRRGIRRASLINRDNAFNYFPGTQAGIFVSFAEDAASEKCESHQPPTLASQHLLAGFSQAQSGTPIVLVDEFHAGPFKSSSYDIKGGATRATRPCLQLVHSYDSNSGFICQLLLAPTEESSGCPGLPRRNHAGKSPRHVIVRQARLGRANAMLLDRGRFVLAIAAQQLRWPP